MRLLCFIRCKSNFGDFCLIRCIQNVIHTQRQKWLKVRFMSCTFSDQTYLIINHKCCSNSSCAGVLQQFLCYRQIYCLNNTVFRNFYDQKVDFNASQTYMYTFPVLNDFNAQIVVVQNSYTQDLHCLIFHCQKSQNSTVT